MTLLDKYLKAVAEDIKLNNVQQAVETTWASDKFSFPLQIANISMTDIDTIYPRHVLTNNNVVL